VQNLPWRKSGRPHHPPEAPVMGRNIKFLVKDIEDATRRAAQSAAVEIMNGLAKAGPAYTGRFSSAWYALPRGLPAGGPRGSGRIYTYTRRNVPLARFQAGTWYEIKNGSDYAAEAMDLVPYVPEVFKRQQAVKTQKYGSRPEGGRRGELSGSGGNTSTAPLDWWARYNAAGQLQADLARGFRAGFGTARGF
jgi:hypothetical protein